MLIFTNFVRDPFWFSVIIAIVGTIIQYLGFSYVAERTSHSRVRRAWAALRTAKITLSAISAQEKFAQWARQRRLVDQLQATYDKENKDRKGAISFRITILSLILRFIVWVGIFLWTTSFGSRIAVMPLDRQLFGPVVYILNFPFRIPFGVLSVPTIMAITTISIRRVLHDLTH